MRSCQESGENEVDGEEFFLDGVSDGVVGEHRGVEVAPPSRCDGAAPTVVGVRGPVDLVVQVCPEGPGVAIQLVQRRGDVVEGLLGERILPDRPDSTFDEAVQDRSQVQEHITVEKRHRSSCMPSTSTVR